MLEIYESPSYQLIMLQIMNKIYLIVIVQQVFGYTSKSNPYYQYLEYKMVQAEQGFGYGLWIKYAPLFKIGQVGNVLQNQSNSSLLTYIKDIDTQKLQMVVQLTSDYENQIIKFEAFVNSNSETYHFQQFIDPMNFEGFWYKFYFQCKPDEHKCQALFLDPIENWTIFEINKEYPFQQSNNLQIVIGGGLKQDWYLLTQFPGYMMYESFELKWFYDYINIYSQNIKIFENCQFLPQLYHDILFDEDSRIKFDQSQSLNGYKLIAWYKLVQVQSSASDVSIIRVSQNGKQDFGNHIGGNAFGFSMNWDLVKTIAQFTTYSYKFPMINLDVSQGDPFQINQIYNLQKDDLNQWAFLQFSFSLRNLKMLFQVQYPQNSIQYVNQNARQFSKAVSSVYIGNNYLYNSKQQGIVKKFQFDYCDGQDDFQATYCHITCETCFGPYEFQCLSCQQGSSRVFKRQTNTCACSLGHVDSGEWQCFGQDSTIVILYTQSQDCVWGQFIYNNKCYQCPNQSNTDPSINCIECLANPLSWVQDPYCYVNYQQQIKGSNQVYLQLLETKRLQFIMQNEQLILVNVGCGAKSILYEGQCVDCYDPNCEECSPIFLKQPCSECQSEYVFDPSSNMCVENFAVMGARKCPKFCDSLCTFCSCKTKNCKTCITGFYVGFDYNCHQCSILNCIKCFEFNLYDQNYNTLNFSFEPIDQSMVQVGCVECGEGYIYDFVLQICKLHKQVAPCLSSFINLDSIEVCTLERGQQFSGVAPQISDCTGLISNCQRCIQAQGRITCVKCVDGYYYEIFLGTCLQCNIINAIACTILSAFESRYLLEDYQGFYFSFRNDGLLYIGNSLAVPTNPVATKCQAGYELYDMGCYKQCDINCKTCIFNPSLNQYICLQCYPQNGLPIFSLINGQCVKCPYLCEVCYPRNLDQIKLINSRFNLTEENQYLTYACIKAASGYVIDNDLQVVKYFDDGMQQGRIQIVKNIDFYSYDLNYLREPFDLIDFLNIRQPDSFTFNFTLGIQQPSLFILSTNIKNNVFILSKINFNILGIIGQHEWFIFQFILSGFDQVHLENLNFQVGQQKIFQLLDGEYVIYCINQKELQAKNITFSNSGNSMAAFDMKVQNTTLIAFEVVAFNQYNSENTILIDLVQEHSLIINMTNITFYNCTFSNFSIFKTNTNLRNLKVYINGIKFLNCTLNNFQLIQNSIQTNNTIQINNFFIQFCNFVNMSLIQQLTHGNLKLYQIYFYQSNLINSNVVSLSSNSLIQELIIQQCNLINSKIVSLNSLASSIGQVYLTISNISIQNVTYDSSKLIELDSYNFFKFNLILENISLKYNQQMNINQNQLQGFWVIRCQNLQISNVQIVRKYLNSIEFMLVNVSNVDMKNFSVEGDLDNSFANALIAVDQFQNIRLENIIILGYRVVDSPIIFITSQSQLFIIQSETIFIKNITFIQNTIKKQILGKFESMIYIVSNNYQQINIQDVHFVKNIIQEQIQNNDIDSSGLLYISSIYADLMLQNIFSMNDSILNTTNTLFYIQANKMELNYFEAQLVNQLSKVQSSVGVLIISSNIINLQNVFIRQVNSQIVGFMKLQTGQQGIINIENMTIQGIYTFNTDPFAIDESIIQIDQQISQLLLDIKNVLIKSCVLGSGGFLRINSKNIQNSINLLNIKLINVYSFKCQFICMILNSLIQYQNNIDISDVTLINDNGYELDLFIENKINLHFQNLESLLNLNNSIIQVSYTNITINNLYLSGELYVGFLMLTDMENIVLINVNLVNSNIVSSFPLYLTLNKNKFSRVLINNVIISNITINNKINRSLLELQPIYEYSFLQISLIVNGQQFKAYNIMIQQVNCLTCSNGFLLLCSEQGQNIKLSVVNFIFNNNKCGIESCIVISNSYQSHINFANSFIFDNQANNGIMQIANLSVSFNNVSFIQNRVNKNGSAIAYESNWTSWNNLQLIENTGVQSGGLITLSTDFLNFDKSQITFLFNSAKQKSDNLLCQATKLVLVFYNIELQHMTIKQENIIINSPIIKGQNYLQFPIIDDKLSSYQLYDLQKEEYLSSNLLYDLYPTNEFMEVQSHYQNYTCQLNTNDQLLNITYSQKIQFYNQQSAFDTIYFRSNPYSYQQLAIITIECDFIKNYKYVFKAKFLPCQLGEYYFNQTCKKCDQSQGFYSVTFNATSCVKADTSVIQNNTSNNLRLQKYYWRPTRLSPYIQYCHQNIMNCLGGWSTGDQSCLIGHSGALCEQCDIYNTRGDGQFTQNYGLICAKCGQAPEIDMIIIIGSLIWTLISVFVTVRSIIQSNKKLKNLKQINRKFFQILFRQEQDQSGTLIKMAIYDMQIIQAIYTFQINFQFNMSSFNDFFSFPVDTVTYNIQCQLSSISETPIIYLRIIWVLLISMFTIIMFIMLYLIYLVIKKQKYESVVIYTSLLYMYVYIQPNIFRQVSSLIASRTISNLKWIQGHVAYRYDTESHYKWILGFAIPVITNFGVTIPLLFFILLYRYRQDLVSDGVRNKIGYLYNEYRQHSFYWENVKIIHMQFIIFILTIYQDEIQLKACIIYLIVFFYYVLQQYQQPYNHSKLNKFENHMIFVIGVCLILSLAIYSAQQAQQTKIFSFMILLQIILNLLLVYIYVNFIIRLILAIFERLYSQIDQINDLIITQEKFLRRFAPGIIRYLNNRIKQKARVYKRFQLIRSYLIERVQEIKNCNRQEQNNYKVCFKEGNSMLKTQAQALETRFKWILFFNQNNRWPYRKIAGLINKYLIYQWNIDDQAYKLLFKINYEFIKELRKLFQFTGKIKKIR